MSETNETLGAVEPMDEDMQADVVDADEQAGLAVAEADEPEADEPEAEDPEADDPETTVTCTEHTPENLRGYAILLVAALFVLVSSLMRVATLEPGTERVLSALAIVIAAIAAALAGYMLLVWKNRQVVVDEQGITITDFLGKESSFAWDRVKIVDRRATSTPELAFRVSSKREETFSSTCGGFRRMCELLIRMRKLRRIDEKALAKKRKAKSLFDVVQGGRREERIDESLYLPEDDQAQLPAADESKADDNQ